MHSDGSGADLLSLPGGGSRFPASEATVHDGKHFIHMDGRAVYRFATRVMAQATTEALEAARLTTADVQWIIPHQANLRIIESAARGLKLPMDRFIVNLDRYGNTSTASIPIAAVEALQKSQIKPGDKIVLVAFGGGLTWGALVAQWTGPLPAKQRVHTQPYQAYGRARSWYRRLYRFIESLFNRREL
jgi:3-oxoacyl-[acyl-carrier-protein] synthase-3